MAKTRLPQTLGERISSLNLAEQLATITTGYTPDPPKELQEPTYYDYPVLQEPLWHWEIYWYFFFGGLAAGCYIIATIASLFASPEDRVITRTGYYLSLLAFLPCPPLLIKDLGKPERLLHMLRIVKASSLQSLGKVALVILSRYCGLPAALAPARERRLV